MFSLPPLPYARNALAPYISERTLDFHHGKHHQAYYDNLGRLLDGKPEADATLEEIIRATAGDPERAGVFNNAAQTWNHSFYWQSMKPNGGGEPSGELAAAMARDFGGYQAFREAFAKAGATQFGSGWAWLVARNGKLEISKTANAETPLAEAGATPLLTMDVWEHAYYLDFQNRRPDYIAVFLDHLVNWDFAARNFAQAAQA